ncbi:MAG: hypothetical protein AB7G13_22750 [Lautropia sp.]
MSPKIFHLREIAHSRAGDKGDTSNVSVIAYRDEFFPVIVEQVTVDAVRAHFGALAKGRISCYALPQFSALNFVLEESLGGGVTRSLSLDPHGKSYSALMLALPVVIDEALSAMLVEAGRRPIDGRLLARLGELGRLPAHVIEALN